MLAVTAAAGAAFGASVAARAPMGTASAVTATVATAVIPVRRAQVPVLMGVLSRPDGIVVSMLVAQGGGRTTE
ncbi:hypothetical protein ACE1SV_26660 [Streptomyces sennicomposti]